MCVCKKVGKLGQGWEEGIVFFFKEAEALRI